MDDRTRKLSIAGLAAALFVGFIFLTRWTGDDPNSVSALGDQEQDELAQFCFVFSGNFVPYELLLRAAAGQSVSQDEAGQLGILDSGVAQSLAENQIDMLADRVPEEYGADARRAAEGLQRALDGDLDADEVEEYVAGYQRLQDSADDDCAALGAIDIDSGDLDSPDGGGNGGGFFGEDEQGPVDGDSGEPISPLPTEMPTTVPTSLP
jgi:hypothetical protein